MITRSGKWLGRKPKYSRTWPTNLPVLNPRDLIDPIAEAILDLDPHAEFILMVTDPRDHKEMSIRTTLHEPTKGTFMRTLVQALWPLEEDSPHLRIKKIRAFESEKIAEENPE